MISWLVSILVENQYQYLSAKNEATPALIHSSSFSFEGNSINITKLVECPVVLKVPALLTTLYNGQLYKFSVDYYLSVTGTKCIKGKSLYNSFGRGVVIKCFFLSHLAPSKNIP